MAWDWLFGSTDRSTWNKVVRSYTLDIDVVSDVYRILDTRARAAYAVELANFDATNQANEHRNLPRGELESIAAEQKQRLSELERSFPQIRLMRPTIGMITPTEIVPVENIQSLPKHDRRFIMVDGSGVTVDFRRSHQPTIFNSGPDELTSTLMNLLADEGTPRVLWSKLLRFAPLVGAVALTALGIWALITEEAPTPVAVFVYALLATIWIIAVVAYSSLRERFKDSWPGHRFREASRAKVRERLENTRATVIVSLFTVPVGAIIGWLLTLWFGG